MIADKLERIRELKRRATAFRNRKKYKESLQLLDTAIADLKDLQKAEDIDEHEAQAVRAELADTYGMKGGVYRRIPELNRALAEYRCGMQIEDLDKQSTYNASNVITLSISQEHKAPSDPDLSEHLHRVIDDLEQKTQAGRSDEWWAWSDLGQFYLLRNDVDKSRSVYRRAIQTGPTGEEYRRHLDILHELAAATRESTPDVSKGISQMLAELERQTP